jgi:hypothetical protein
MSEMGHKRKYSLRANVFRFTPKTGQGRARLRCPLSATTRLMQRSKATVAPQQITRLFDNLVGALQKRLWNRQPDRLGGCGIEDEIEFSSAARPGYRRASPD